MSVIVMSFALPVYGKADIVESDIDVLNELSRDAAQMELGYYLLGSGDQKDIKLAVEQFEKAAKQNNIDAMYLLAKLYAGGNGVEVNVVKTFYWLDLAMKNGHKEAIVSGNSLKEFLKEHAEKGNGASQFKLGLMLLNGFLLTKKDIKTAANWFERSAEQGVVVSQLFIGSMYWNGYGVDKDVGSAVKWLVKVSDKGYKIADYYLVNIYLSESRTNENIANATKHWMKYIENGMPEYPKLSDDEVHNIVLLLAYLNSPGYSLLSNVQVDSESDSDSRLLGTSVKSLVDGLIDGLFVTPHSD